MRPVLLLVSPRSPLSLNPETSLGAPPRVSLPLPTSFFCLVFFFPFHSFPKSDSPNYQLTPTAFPCFRSRCRHHSPPYLLIPDVDPISLSRSDQIGSKPYNPSNIPRNSPLAGSVGGADAGDATTATKNPRELRSHHSSSTVLMLENALAAVRDDASQLPLSDLVHASTMIRDLESVLRERLSRTMGDDGEMVDSAGGTIGRP